jgi:hypothetical protein
MLSAWSLNPVRVLLSCPSAAVAAVRREPGQLDGPEQHLVGHQVVAVVTAGVLGAHRVFEFHARTLSPAAEE